MSERSLCTVCQYTIIYDILDTWAEELTKTGFINLFMSVMQ